MPKFTFECEPCQTQFTRNLPMGEHPSHPCPTCALPAPRMWMGQGFGFGFAPSPTAAPANTGVAKNDYPTADQVVGSHAEARWGIYNERAKVKEKVREVGGSHILKRRQGDGYVEYEAGSEAVVAARKALTRQAQEQGVQGASSTDALVAQMERDTGTKPGQ